MMISHLVNDILCVADTKLLAAAFRGTTGITGVSEGVSFRKHTGCKSEANKLIDNITVCKAGRGQQQAGST